MMKHLALIWLVIALIGFRPVNMNMPQGVLNATLRSGQVFLTWPERSDLSNERYRVYWHSAPITVETLPQARLLATLAEGSSVFYANRYLTSGGSWANRYFSNYVIADGAAMLPNGTGLFVDTLTPFRSGYYAVTVTPVGGNEQFDAAFTAGPVGEGALPADPLAVHTALHPGTGAHVLIQYMDAAAWNGTFHAPNSTNDYYGLNSGDPRFLNTLQYAYEYVVVEPRAVNCGGTVPNPAPVMVLLHGYGGNMYAPYPDDHYMPAFCAYLIYPYDVTETWWFGFAQQNDYRLHGQPTAGDVIVNYTEQRVLRMIHDLSRAPISVPVDMNRVYVAGASMGGSGTLAFAMRYPDVFAGAYASTPMTNYRTSTYNDGFFVDDLTIKWGSPAQNLPVQLSAPAGWGGSLARYNGMGVWDWQNHQLMVQIHQQDFVPFGMAHNTGDTVIDWQNQAVPFYTLLDASRQTWAGAITDDDHHDERYNLLPPTMATNAAGVPFDGLQVLRMETVPGFSNATSNPPFPQAILFRYNTAIRWAASWDAWDDAPVDTATRWEMSLCAVNKTLEGAPCGTGQALSVDITLRRLQNFRVVGWNVYTWENYNVSNNALVASGEVLPSYGKITIPQVNLSPQGNRLVVYPAAVQPDAIFLPVVIMQ